MGEEGVGEEGVEEKKEELHGVNCFHFILISAGWRIRRAPPGEQGDLGRWCSPCLFRNRPTKFRQAS